MTTERPLSAARIPLVEQYLAGRDDINPTTRSSLVWMARVDAAEAADAARATAQAEVARLLLAAILSLRREQMFPDESWWADKRYRGVSEADAAREVARFITAALASTPAEVQE